MCLDITEYRNESRNFEQIQKTQIPCLLEPQQSAQTQTHPSHPGNRIVHDHEHQQC